MKNETSFKASVLGYKDSNLEMLESESSALPFGDSPISITNAIIHEMSVECKCFLQKIFKKILGKKAINMLDFYLGFGYNSKLKYT